MTMGANLMKEYTGLTLEERKKQYLRDRELVQKARDSQIRFLSSHLKLKMGVNVFGGQTGRGKSTACSNLLADFNLNYPKRQAVVITNEELASDVLDKAACIQLGINYYEYRKEEGDPKVREQAIKLLQNIEIVEGDGLDMTCLDDVATVMLNAAKRNVDLIVVDYLQTVTWSRKYEGASRYEISKKLGSFLQKFGKMVRIPVVVFAQIRGQRKDQVMTFEDRIEGDKTFVNHATLAVEIAPDFETKTTKFIVHKNRFDPNQLGVISFKWDWGRLIKEEELEL